MPTYDYTTIAIEHNLIDAAARSHDFRLNYSWLPELSADVFAPRPNAETHAVYAVIDTVHGVRKVRVSEHLTGNKAWDIHALLEVDFRKNGKDRRDERGRFAPARRRIMNPGYTINGWPVRYFAVRATNDPDWPKFGQVQKVRSTL